MCPMVAVTIQMLIKKGYPGDQALISDQIWFKHILHLLLLM